MGQTVSALVQSQNQRRHEQIQKTLHAMVLAGRKCCDRQKLVQAGTVNDRAVGVIVIRIPVMFVLMRRRYRNVTFIRGKRDLLATCPGRSGAGEKDQATASDDNQALHRWRSQLCLVTIVVSRVYHSDDKFLERSLRHLGMNQVLTSDDLDFPALSGGSE